MPAEHRLIIGRDPSCDVVLNDPYASPQHAALIWVRDPGVVQIEDIGSTNGVWLNKERVWGRRMITFTDTLLIGRTQLEVGMLLLRLAYARGIAEGLRQVTEGCDQYEYGRYDPDEARVVAYDGTPRTITPKVLRRPLVAVGPWEPAPTRCCDLHGRNCEQGGEECCEHCTEAHHFAPGHGGVPCSAPDLSGKEADRG